jgi:hypothetical protein
VSILTVMLIVIFVLVVIPIVYWIGLGVSRLVRQRGHGA